MEEKQKSVTMNGLWYGAIAAVIMIVIHLILYLADQHLNRSITWISLIFLIAVMIWGTIDYRKKELDGYMTYGKAYSTSFMIALFAIIIGAIYTFIFYQLIAPEAIQDLLEMGRQENLERYPEMSDEDLDRAMEWSAIITSPVGLAIVSLIVQTIPALIICLITSIFLKKEDKSVSSTL